MPVTLVDCRTTHYQLSGFTDEVHDQDITVARVLTGVLLKDAQKLALSTNEIDPRDMTPFKPMSKNREATASK